MNTPIPDPRPERKIIADALAHADDDTASVEPSWVLDDEYYLSQADVVLAAMDLPVRDARIRAEVAEEIARELDEWADLRGGGSTRLPTRRTRRCGSHRYPSRDPDTPNPPGMAQTDTRAGCRAAARTRCPGATTGRVSAAATSTTRVRSCRSTPLRELPPMSTDPTASCPQCAISPHAEPDAPHVHLTDFGYVLFAPNREMRDYIEEIRAIERAAGRTAAANAAQSLCCNRCELPVREVAQPKIFAHMDVAAAIRASGNHAPRVTALVTESEAHDAQD